MKFRPVLSGVDPSNRDYDVTRMLSCTPSTLRSSQSLKLEKDLCLPEYQSQPVNKLKFGSTELTASLERTGGGDFIRST